MIDDESSQTTGKSADEADDLDEISKSQRKRDADSVRELGVRLSELGASELATIPIPDEVLAAIKELNRLKAHGARKRQIGFLAKRMRQIDVAPIEEALEKIRQTARANTMSLHRVEQWRDRLLGDVPEESPKEALTQFLDEFVQADRQHFRHLQRQALAERQKNRPPASARQLFKSIRDVLLDSPDE